MRTDLVARLRGNADIAAIQNDRVYWGKRKPKDLVPATVLNLITIGNQYTFGGPTGFYGTRVQFDFLGMEVRDFDPLFWAVKGEMERAVTIGGTAFGMSFLDGQRDMPFVDVPGLGTVGGISADFIIWWKSLT